MSDSIIKIRKKLIREQKKKKPSFRRQDWFRHKKLTESWRRPRGRHSKLRKYKGSRGKRPSIGYGTPFIIRGMHPSGYEEVLVRNAEELRSLDPSTQAARYASSIGSKKRAEMNAEADKLGIKVLNR